MILDIIPLAALLWSIGKDLTATKKAAFIGKSIVV